MRTSSTLRTHPTRASRWLLVSAVALFMSACGISPDAAPREIERVTEDDGADDTESGGDEAGGTGQIFLVEPDAGGIPARLVSVQRDVGNPDDLDPTSVLESLFAGPNVDERERDVTTVLPTGLTLLSWSPRSGGVVSVDLPEALAELSGDTLVLALAQIVHTVSAVDGVKGVRINIDGSTVGWPDVNGRIQDDPLTIYDYPGLLPTTQPDFPAVPSD